MFNCVVKIKKFCSYNSLVFGNCREYSNKSLPRNERDHYSMAINNKSISAAKGDYQT